MTEAKITLAQGGHPNPAAGMCLLEAASFVAGEEFSDHPQCVSSVLGAYGRSLNDVLPDDKRQELAPLIPRLIGTRGDGKDERRSYLALDWLIRTYLPTFLALSLPDQAEKVRSLAPIADIATARAAGPVVSAAGDAAWAAARAAARDAAWDAARDAAWAAARAAAWAAAGDAARDAAWDAARDAAWAAARAAARAAAGDAARAAAGDAARAAAGDAARDFLAPTVATLQDSAIRLLSEQLIDVP